MNFCLDLAKFLVMYIILKGVEEISIDNFVFCETFIEMDGIFHTRIKFRRIR
jgi:hypothetical protein